MYGTFTKAFQKTLRPFVNGKRIVDLGSGDGTRAVMLCATGARSVLSIDVLGAMRSSPQIEYVEISFAHAAAVVREAKPDVAHLAWPSNIIMPSENQALIKILGTIKRVIYVGKNTDGVACGTPELFGHFLQRPVLALVRDPRNTMIVYGDVQSRRRAPGDVEERAGLDNTNYEKIYEYEGTSVTSEKMIEKCRDKARRQLVKMSGSEYRPVTISLEQFLMSMVGRR